MDIYKVEGIASYDFVNDQNQRISGVKYHLSATPPLNNPNFQGRQVTIIGVSTGLLQRWSNAGLYIPQLGEECLIYFNQKGRIEQFSPVGHE